MHRFSLIKTFTSFAMLGAEWVMWVLVALSLASIALMIERYRFYRSLEADLDVLSARLEALLAKGDVVGAQALLRPSRSPAALVALRGLDAFHRGVGSAEHVMNGALARVKQQLDRGLSFIGTIGNNAPFVGLFGTVIGIIQAFDKLKQSETAARDAARRAVGRRRQRRRRSRRGTGRCKRRAPARGRTRGGASSAP